MMRFMIEYHNEKKMQHSHEVLSFLDGFDEERKIVLIFDKALHTS